jgi:DNA invertase Pin-like site-specific DNA recombinase
MVKPSEILVYSDSHVNGPAKPLSERIKAGIAEARERGVRLGRPKGALTAGELLDRHSDVATTLREGQSINKTAAITGKSVSTVQKVKSLLLVAA